MTSRIEKINHIAQKFGMGKMEAQSVLKAIEMKQKAENAQTFEELKEVVVAMVNDKYNLSRHYQEDQILLSLSQLGVTTE